jgi:glycosyltransferase involved in cell wall biosynthesis
MPRVLACCGHMVTPGGLERMTFEVLATLRRHGAAAHCLVNRWGSTRIVSLAERAGVSWSIARSDQPLRRRPGSPAAAARMWWEIVRASGDVLAARRTQRATHLLLPDFLVAVRAWPALALLRLRGYRVVLRVGMAPPLGRFYAALWRVAVNAAVDRMVCNSEFLYAEVRRLGIPTRKLRMIRNAAVPRVSVGGTTPHPHRIVYIGQIIPDKGVDILIDAVSRLRHDGVPATLDIVGEMSGWESPTYRGYRERLRRQAGDPVLAGAVRFLGFRDDVTTLLADAVVHCCPSREAIREGMANVVLEAKAAGIPSVVTRSGSLPELVTHQVDGWIAADDPAALAEGLSYFLEDDVVRQRAGAAARQSLQRFGRDAFDQAWLEEFDVPAAPIRSRLRLPSLSR